MFNIDLATKVLDHIKSDPEHWDQRWYGVQDDCGTTYCFAGWAVKLADPQAQFRFDHDGSAVYVNPSNSNHSCRIVSYAADLLGLNYDDGDMLFYWANDLNELEKLINDFKRGKK